jgi:hypothetical protein
MKVELARRIQEDWTELVKQTASSVGVDAAEMFVVDSKLLLSPPGKGQQAVHWDTARTPASASLYSCILYCSNGCSSTALPRFPINDAFNFSTDPAAMRPVAHLLKATNYESLPVSAGDLVFFRSSTPHFGVRNTMPQGNRVVLFSMLSANSQTGQDALQVFPWLYMGSAFGFESIEFAQELVESREHKPLVYIKGDESAAAYEATVACLKKWNLFEKYNS